MAVQQLKQIARALAAERSGAAATLREGLEERLSVIALGVSGALYRTLRTTNPIENPNGSLATFIRNVERWRDGSMFER